MISYEDLQKIQEKYPQIEIIVSETGFVIKCPNDDELYLKITSELDALEVKYNVVV